MIVIKRIYEKAETEDGFRILVDRLWPRGISKESAKIDLWLKDIAPSNELRKWFSHERDKWPEFQERYGKELQDKKELVDTIKSLEREKGTITLLFSTKELANNNAVALREYLKGK